MNHPDKYIAKRYDTPNRSKAFTDIVYCNEIDGTRSSIWAIEVMPPNIWGIPQERITLAVRVAFGRMLSAAIFEALKAKRTYAFMMGSADGGMCGRMEIDFRINGHFKFTISLVYRMMRSQKKI